MSGNYINKIVLIIIALGLAQCAVAAELFGVQLGSSSIDQLRRAVKKAGASMVVESDEGRPYDIFDSAEVIPGSSRLYIGHGGENRQIAFVEYEFPGLKQPGILKMMSNKYGAPTVRKGRFVSDRRYFWEVNGVRITFRVDWQNYRTLLSYVVPEVMSNMQKFVNAKIVDSSYY